MNPIIIPKSKILDVTEYLEVIKSTKNNLKPFKLDNRDIYRILSEIEKIIIDKIHIS